MTQFAFLSPEFPALLDPAKRAEAMALSDPRGACFYARLALETALGWMYRSDPALRSPYDSNLSALIHEPSLEKLTGPAIVAKAKFVKDQGNRAVHDPRPVSTGAATAAVRELFHVCYWVARTYARRAQPPAGLAFDPGKLEKTLTISASTVAQIEKLRAEHDARAKALSEAEAARMASEEGRAALEAEIARLREEIAAVRRANEATPDTHDYDEATTRDAFINLLLHEAGWPLAEARDREWPVAGMPSGSGEGFVDYVLWGDDGKLRDLVKLIEPGERKIVYTDFEDEIGGEVDSPIGDAAVGVDAGRFKMKVRRFLETHAEHLALQKVRRAEQLTASDVAELERMFLGEGVGDEDRLDAIRREGGLGLFFRSLLGLDRHAAKAAFSSLTDLGSLSASQIQFIDLIVNHLTERGVIDPALLYESPFTDVSDQGLSGVFPPKESADVLEIVRRITETAAA